MIIVNRLRLQADGAYLRHDVTTVVSYHAPLSLLIRLTAGHRAEFCPVPASGKRLAAEIADFRL